MPPMAPPKKRAGGRGPKGKAPAPGSAARYKPYKAYRIPMVMAELFKECAAEEVGTDATEHVRRACRAYLIKRGKIKAPDAEGGE